MLIDWTVVRAISFDAGGTLLDPWPSVGDVYARVAERHGLHLSPTSLNQQFRAAWRAKSGFDYSRLSWASLVDGVFGGLVPTPLAVELFEDLYDAFAHPEAWRVLPDAVPTLEALRHRHFKMAVVSNWDDRLPRLLEVLHLSRFFDVIVYSFEVGAAKPDPRIFQKAEHALGCAGRAILHVGDSPVEDLSGARAIGWQAVLLRRIESIPQPDIITSLTQLV